MIGYRQRLALPQLGPGTPRGSVLLDTNVFINALRGRGPPVLKALLSSLPRSFISGPVFAELNWPKGRLDPTHPDTFRVLNLYDRVVDQLEPRSILSPSAGQWARAGILAGQAARAVGGRSRSVKTAFDRTELINDAATAIVALDFGATVVTQDGDFDLFLQLEPSLAVLFYD